MKKLLNEQLPAPVIAPRGSPRDRVFRHMRDALAAGASVALLTGCPFAVVDPLPPPAQCRTMMGAGKLVSVTVLRATEADGGAGDVTLKLTWAWDAGLILTPPKVMNGTLVSSTESSQSAEVTVSPAAGATQFDVVFPATCDDQRTAPRKLGIRLIVDLAALTATASEVPAP